MTGVPASSLRQRGRFFTRSGINCSARTSVDGYRCISSKESVQKRQAQDDGIIGRNELNAKKSIFYIEFILFRLVYENFPLR